MRNEHVWENHPKKDAKNASNAAENPGSFETKTQIPPEAGYDFSYHNLVCPLSNFARKYGYQEYMPYLCNLDYVMFGVLEAPLYREHTCFEDGDYCDQRVELIDTTDGKFMKKSEAAWMALSGSALLTGRK